MPDSTTANYGWTKPEVGGSNDSWGTKLNITFDGIDTSLKAVSEVANGAAAGVAGKLNASAFTGAATLALLLPVDGTGTGLDADLLDGKHAADFVLATAYTAADVRTKLLTVDGAASGIDSDLLDGQHGAFYADIPARLGFTPVNPAAPVLTGHLTGTTATFSGDITSSSDRRLKDDIEDLDGEALLATLRAIGAKSFTMNGARRYGVIAQDVAETALRALVRTERDGNLSVAYLGFIAPLIAVVLHLSDEVARLKGEK